MPHPGGRNQVFLPIAATGLGIGVYALAVLWTSRHPSWLTLVLAALPFLWLAAAYAKGVTRVDLSAPARLGRVVPLILVVGVLGLAWAPLATNVRVLYLIQHLGIHAALFWLFARTLSTGSTPLCTELASWVHEDMSSPALLWYTRQVTKAWAIFFALMVILSTLIFMYATQDAWMVFSAVVGPILTAALFLAENLVRSRFLPPQDRVGLAGTWRAVQARMNSQREAPSARRSP